MWNKIPALFNSYTAKKADVKFSMHMVPSEICSSITHRQKVNRSPMFTRRSWTLT